MKIIVMSDGHGVLGAILLGALSEFEAGGKIQADQPA
jgi:hypothetical protein